MEERGKGGMKDKGRKEGQKKKKERREKVIPVKPSVTAAISRFCEGGRAHPTIKKSRESLRCKPRFF